MKVRIIELRGAEYYEDSYAGPIYTLDEVTDWDDLKEDEVEALYLWAQHENNKNRDKKIVIITEKTLHYKKMVANYLDQALKAKQQIFEEERRKKESEEKIKKQEKEKKLKRKLNQLEKLKKELESYETGV